MRRFALFALATLLLSPIFDSAPAQAQMLARTWVSGTGDDTAVCNRTAPCKTFSSAIGKTIAGGEISCLDSGAFTAVNITKAITLSCEGVSAGVLANGIDGITINAGPTDEVYLKGLDINGVSAGLTGVKFITGKSLTIEDSHVYGFQLGVEFTPSSASFLTIINSTISGNGLPNIGGGIRLAPASGGYGLISMHNVRIIRNYIGIGGSTTGTAIAEIFNSTISNNSSDAISVSGNTTVRVGLSMIAGNGGNATSGNVLSYGDNRINGNNPNTTPSIISLR